MPEHVLETTVHCGHGGRIYRFGGHGDPVQMIAKTMRMLRDELTATEDALRALDGRGRINHWTDGKSVRSWDVRDLAGDPNE